jgi:MFS family permease
MTALSGMARNFPQLFIARMGVGVGEAGCVPPAHSLISDYFPRTKRAFAISLYATGSAIGVAGGMAVVGIMGHQFGWRTTMQVIGLMGIPLALIAVLTLKEPQRPKSESAVRELPWQTITALLRRRAFVHLALGYALASVCGEGGAQWYPSFIMRSFGMSMTHVGIWVGLITAGFGVLGVLSGGYLASLLMPRDPRWEQWVPLGATVLCVPLFLIMVFSPNATMAIAMRAILIFFTAAGQAVATAAVQSFAEPQQRATAVALILFLAALLGGGGGPYLVGMMSDLFAPVFGKESLRYGILVSGVMLVWAAVHFYLASRNGLKDRVN